MRLKKVEVGLRVKITRLYSTKGYLVAEKHLKVRQVGVTGTIRCWVPGHGGDVWVVDQDDGKVGVYRFDEFQPIKD